MIQYPKLTRTDVELNGELMLIFRLFFDIEGVTVLASAVRIAQGRPWRASEPTKSFPPSYDDTVTVIVSKSSSCSS